MTAQDLREYGFPESAINILRCRLCGVPCWKYKIVTLYENNPELKTTLKFGWCRKYTHGGSVVRFTI